MVTTGLGAGSYPEPPYQEQPIRHLCEICGDDYDLRRLDNQILCRSCREKIYVSDCQSEAWEFVNSTPIEKYTFAYDFWFSLLPTCDQAEILMKALRSEFSLGFPWQKNKLATMLKDYMKEYKNDFSDYMDDLKTSSINDER